MEPVTWLDTKVGYIVITYDRFTNRMCAYIPAMGWTTLENGERVPTFEVLQVEDDDADEVR